MSLTRVFPSDQAETVSRRVVKFAELMQSVWMSQNDYERRARAACSTLFHCMPITELIFLVLLYSSSMPLLPHSPGGLLLRSQEHTSMPKRIPPRSKHTSRARSVNGLLNVKILPHCLEMSRRNSRRMACGSGYHNWGSALRLVALLYLPAWNSCKTLLTCCGHRT